MNVAAKREQIKLCAKQLKLETFADIERVIDKVSPEFTFEDILLELMQNEIELKRENRIKRRLKAAHFPYLKTLDEFDMSKLNKSISSSFIRELACCDFIDGKKNIIFIGNPGTGKTHLSIALGIKACYADKSVLYTNASALSTALCEAKDDHTLGTLTKKIELAQLLILDELSYLSFNKHQSELLFRVLSERSERSSTIISTNLPFSQWTELFENETMVAALVDRLTFHSHVLDMNGKSYRLRTAIEHQKG